MYVMYVCNVCMYIYIYVLYIYIYLYIYTYVYIYIYSTYIYIWDIRTYTGYQWHNSMGYDYKIL